MITMKHILLFSTLTIFQNCISGQISEQRQLALDSIVSAMEPTLRTNLQAAHQYLDSNGETEEEKTWLFYGYLGTYFKYDEHREGDSKASFNSPELTAKNQKGICRDFTRVLEYLCTSSNIPCFTVRGKTSMSAFDYLRRKFQRVSTKTNHQWNIARVNGTWILMDPTWTKISSKKKITLADTAHPIKSFTIKSVDRTYYNPSPEFIAKTHAPIHPAFCLSSKVPTYKTTQKPASKQQIYRNNYDYKLVLDSLWTDKNKMFSKSFVNETFNYSNVWALHSLFRYELNSALVKPNEDQVITLEFYDQKIEQIQELLTYIQEVFNLDYSGRSNETIETLRKRKKLLEKELNPDKDQV